MSFGCPGVAESRARKGCKFYIQYPKKTCIIPILVFPFVMPVIDLTLAGVSELLACPVDIIIIIAGPSGFAQARFLISILTHFNFSYEFGCSQKVLEECRTYDTLPLASSLCQSRKITGSSSHRT